MVAGKSIIEGLWDEMDARYEQLMADGEPKLTNYEIREQDCEDYAEWGRQQGRCQATAYALALMTNPYAPNVDEIKRQARQRWQGQARAAVANSGEGE